LIHNADSESRAAPARGELRLALATALGLLLDPKLVPARKTRGKVTGQRMLRSSVDSSVAPSAQIVAHLDEPIKTRNASFRRL